MCVVCGLYLLDVERFLSLYMYSQCVPTCSTHCSHSAAVLHVCIPTQTCDNFQVIDILFFPFLLILQVISDNCSGLLFKNKRDRKIINVDPKVIE